MQPRMNKLNRAIAAKNARNPSTQTKQRYTRERMSHTSFTSESISNTEAYKQSGYRTPIGNGARQATPDSTQGMYDYVKPKSIKKRVTYNVYSQT